MEQPALRQLGLTVIYNLVVVMSYLYFLLLLFPYYACSCSLGYSPSCVQLLDLFYSYQAVLLFQQPCVTLSIGSPFLSESPTSYVC